MTKKFNEIMQHKEIEFGLFKPKLFERKFARRNSDHLVFVARAKRQIVESHMFPRLDDETQHGLERVHSSVYVKSEFEKKRKRKSKSKMRMLQQ